MMRSMLRLSLAMGMVVMLSLAAAQAFADGITFDKSRQHLDSTVATSQTLTLTHGVIESVASRAALGISSSSLGGNTHQPEVMTPGIAAIPEPSSMVLLGTGLLLVARLVRRGRL